MKGLFAITLREINDHKHLLGGAAVAAIFPLVLPYLPGFGGTTSSEVREVSGVVIALVLTWIFAAVLGSGMIGNGLAQGRFGFFFARPVSGQAIWWGKVLGNLLLVLACQVVILAPSLLVSVAQGVDFDFGARNEALGILIGVFIGLPLLIITFTHALNIMVKARSPWLVLDAAALLTCIGLCWLAMRPLFWLARQGFNAALAFNVVVLVLALLIAGAVQVAVGRTDLQRSHRALSATLWAVLLPAALLTLSYSLWFRDVGPEDLTKTHVSQTAPTGSWIVVSGPAHLRFEYHPRFLFDTRSGHYLRGNTLYSEIAFSSDGKRAAWFEGTIVTERRLVFADLGTGVPTVQSTPLLFAGYPELALSPNSRMVVVIEGQSLSVYELETGRVVSSVRIDDVKSLGGLSFTEADTVRVYSNAGLRSEHAIHKIYELDINSGEFQQTGEKSQAGFGDRLVRDTVNDRIVAIRKDKETRHWMLCDPQTDEILNDYGITDMWQGHSILADGTFVRGEISGGQAWINIFTPGVESARRIPIAQAARIYPRGEASPGIISVSVASENDPWDLNADWQTFAVNLQTGSVTPVPGLGRPASYWWGNTYISNPTRHRLFNDQQGSLLLWDPVSGTVETLVEAHK